MLLNMASSPGSPIALATTLEQEYNSDIFGERGEHTGLFMIYFVFSTVIYLYRQVLLSSGKVFICLLMKQSSSWQIGDMFVPTIAPDHSHIALQLATGIRGKAYSYS